MTGQATVRLNDVARRAGVSAATVSRCINAPASVRADKRARVQSAMESLGYLPHGAARALASKRSRMIGAIFPTIDNALFGSALEVFQHRLAAAGYTVVLASSGYDPDLEARHVRTLLQNGIDALMLVGTARDPAVNRLIEARGIPYINIWRSCSQVAVPCIGFDNVAATEHLSDYLCGLGHRSLAVFSGITRANDRARDRIEGVRRCLARRGLGLDQSRILERPFGVDAGREMFRLLMSQADPPTAIICGSELFAYGAVFEAAEMGIDVPGQVSIAGFDDLWLASQIQPSLTTVRTPQRQIGETAADYLLARLAGQPIAPPRPLDTQLIIRKSTAPPPETAL